MKENDRRLWLIPVWVQEDIELQRLTIRFAKRHAALGLSVSTKGVASCAAVDGCGMVLTLPSTRMTMADRRVGNRRMVNLPSSEPSQFTMRGFGH
jgi:hypothetical protein